MNNKVQAKKWNIINKRRALGCVLCGSHKNLSFHHIEHKSKEIAWLINSNATISQLKRELEKCVVLCKSCHIYVHNKANE